MISNLRNLAAAETRLGFLWWLVDPILMMGIYWVFIVLIFGRDKYAPYPVFIGCALMAWKHLSVSLNKSAGTLQQYEPVIRSVPFPTMALPLSLVFAQFGHFLVGLLVVMTVALVYGVPLGLPLIQLPLLMLCQLSLVVGFSLAVSCWGIVVRDLQQVLSHLLRIGWYLSPGIYGIDLVYERLGRTDTVLPWLSLGDLYMLNPFAILFTGYRAALYAPSWLSPELWILLLLESGAVLGVGMLVYRHYDRRVIKFI